MKNAARWPRFLFEQNALSWFQEALGGTDGGTGVPEEAVLLAAVAVVAAGALSVFFSSTCGSTWGFGS